MRILDLFCGPGGGARGYHSAGFEVLGIDNTPQPSYPYEFILGDALRAADLVDIKDFDLIHASPPCQRYSSLTSCRLKEKGLTPGDVHPDLIGATRDMLSFLGKPYVLENVAGSPLCPTIVLCGTQFGKHVRWHRLFETTFPAKAPAPCDHSLPVMNPFARANHAAMMRKFSEAPETVHARERGIDPSWMKYAERRQALPLYYTRYLGNCFLKEVMK